MWAVKASVTFTLCVSVGLKLECGLEERWKQPYDQGEQYHQTSSLSARSRRASCISAVRTTQAGGVKQTRIPWGNRENWPTRAKP